MGTLAIDGWAVTFDTARRGLGGLQPRAVPSLLYQYNSSPINGQFTNLHRVDCAIQSTVAVYQRWNWLKRNPTSTKKSVNWLKNVFKVITNFAEIWRKIACCRLMDGLLSSMSEAELSELEQTDLYRRSPVLKHARHSLSKNSLTEKSIVMELHKIPERHIGEWVVRKLLNICVHTLSQ